MKINRNQSFYTSKVKGNEKNREQSSGLKFRNSLSTDTVSFSGVRTSLGSDGHLMDKFYLPKNLKANKITLCLQNVAVKLGLTEKEAKDKNCQPTKMKSYQLVGNPEEHDLTSSVKNNRNARKTIPKRKSDRAYFFQLDDKRVLDAGKISGLFKEDLVSLNDRSQMFNVLSDLGEVSVNKAGNMVLIFPDSVTDKRDKKRNCVNQLGGKLSNITKMVEEFQKAGYKRLVLTPTTSDPMSSHKYWAVNLYQTDKGLGSEKDYDEMVTIANRNGINIVSDAAFGKTGIVSYQFQDILLRGKDSPYWNYYSVNDLDNGLIDIGVLTEDTSNVGFKFINSPNRSDYDPNKDTYVQIFDKRLVTDEEASSNKIIMGYKNDDVPREKQKDLIGSSRAVVPYYFPVNPNELTHGKEKKFDINSLEFENYRITKSKYVGFDQWDGMQDLVKEKFYMDNIDNLDFNLTQGEYEERQKGCWQVQDAEIMAGTYSTKRVANLIQEDTASILHEMGVFGKTSKEILDLITSDSSKIKNMVESAPNEIDTECIQKSLESKYYIKDMDFITGTDDYLAKELMSVPFETLEVSQSLLATLSSSAISKRASVEGEVGKSRYEVMTGYNSGDYDVEPYQNVQKKDLKSYKATDEMFTQILVPLAKEILKSVETEDKKIFEGDKLTDLGRYAIKFMAPDIFRYSMYKALNRDIAPTVDENTGRIYYDITDDQREGMSLRSLNSFNRTNPEYDALNAINSIKSGLRNLTGEDKKGLTDILKKRFEHYDTTSLKLASMLVDRAETGLDWRLDAAKDVSNFNLLRTEQETYDNVLDNVSRFWKKFDDAVYLQNPHSYIVGEFTDLDTYAPSPDTMKDYKYPTSSIAEEEIRRDSGMTTYTNYPYLWAMGECFAPDSTNGNVDNEQRGSDPTVWLMSRFITSGWPGNSGLGHADDIRKVNLAYNFVENHDKPRILSVMSLDIGLFFSQFESDEHKKMAAKVVNGDFSKEDYSQIDFTKLSAKSIAMGYRLNQAIDSIKDTSGLSDSEILDLRKAIGQLAGDTTKQSNDAFGVKPINDAIADVIEEAASLKSKTVEQKNAIADKLLEVILKPAATKYVRMYKMLLTLPGSSTDFLGTSMGLTGWEAVCKNPYQQCRGAIPDKETLPQWLKDCLYNPIQQLQQMKQQENLNALIDGVTHALPFKNNQQEDVNVAKDSTGKEVKLAPILRYDLDGNVLVNVYSFEGINNQNNIDEVTNHDLSIPEIVLYDPQNDDDPRYSPFSFKDGTQFKCEGDDSTIYVVENKSDGKCVLKKQGEGDIILSAKDQNTSIFYML